MPTDRSLSSSQQTSSRKVSLCQVGSLPNACPGPPSASRLRAPRCFSAIAGAVYSAGDRSSRDPAI